MHTRKCQGFFVFGHYISKGSPGYEPQYILHLFTLRPPWHAGARVGRCTVGILVVGACLLHVWHASAHNLQPALTCRASASAMPLLPCMDRLESRRHDSRHLGLDDYSSRLLLNPMAAAGILILRLPMQQPSCIGKPMHSAHMGNRQVQGSFLHRF